MKNREEIPFSVILSREDGEGSPPLRPAWAGGFFAVFAAQNDTATMGYKEYWVYMMTNRWKTVLYTGMTNSLEARVWQHKNKAIPGFTSKYNCNVLVYFEEYDEVEQAISRENS